jgi:hypothetical protein
MRTKALLGLAALAASAATCLAQSNVYSLNIVGYVNVDVQGGGKLTLLSNPLKPSNGNYNITNTMVLPDTADGSTIYQWAGTSWSQNTPGWYLGLGWSPDATINLGEAFFIQTANTTTDFKVTFVGEVATGNNTYNMPVGLGFVAPKEPVEQPWPGAGHGHDGDNIYVWNGTAWDGVSWSFYEALNNSWDNGGNPNNNTNGPTVKVGGGVVYQNTGTTPLTWTRTFNP